MLTCAHLVRLERPGAVLKRDVAEHAAAPRRPSAVDRQRQNACETFVMRLIVASVAAAGFSHQAVSPGMQALSVGLSYGICDGKPCFGMVGMQATKC